MTREVEFLFKKNTLFIPVTAEVDIICQTTKGFTLEISGDDPIINHHFPRYCVFAYDRFGEPELAFTSDNYDVMYDYWIENILTKLGG